MVQLGFLEPPIPIVIVIDSSWSSPCDDHEINDDYPYRKWSLFEPWNHPCSHFTLGRLPPKLEVKQVAPVVTLTLTRCVHPILVFPLPSPSYVTPTQVVITPYTSPMIQPLPPKLPQSSPLQVPRASITSPRTEPLSHWKLHQHSEVYRNRFHSPTHAILQVHVVSRYHSQILSPRNLHHHHPN